DGRSQLPVQHAVLWKVLLPEPAAHERDPRAGEKVGGPVTSRVDRLDAIRGPHVALEVGDRRLPVGGVRGGIPGAVDEAGGKWRQIPREGKCERDRADGPRTPVAKRERQDRDRRRGEPKPRDVLA